MEPYTNQVSKHQPPKRDPLERPMRYRSLPVGQSVCRICRTDFPTESLLPGQRCPECHAKIEANIARKTREVEEHQQSELAAGRAEYDVNGYYRELE